MSSELCVCTDFLSIICKKTRHFLLWCSAGVAHFHSGGGERFNSFYRDTQAFGVDGIFTALHWPMDIFFLQPTWELLYGEKKAIRSLNREGVTGCVPTGHCADPRDYYTHIQNTHIHTPTDTDTVAMFTRTVCWPKERKDVLLISTHTEWTQML